MKNPLDYRYETTFTINTDGDFSYKDRYNWQNTLYTKTLNVAIDVIHARINDAYISVSSSIKGVRKSAKEMLQEAIIDFKNELDDGSIKEDEE